MFCMHCGAKTDEDSLFCVSCGKPIQEEPPASVAVSQAAFETPQGYSYGAAAVPLSESEGVASSGSYQMGAPVAPAVAAAPPQPSTGAEAPAPIVAQPAKRGFPKWAIAVIAAAACAVILAVLFVGGFLNFGSKYYLAVNNDGFVTVYKDNIGDGSDPERVTDVEAIDLDSNVAADLADGIEFESLDAANNRVKEYRDYVAAHPRVPITSTWFGEVRGEGSDARLVSIGAIEGSYDDGRDSATKDSPNYRQFTISDTTVSSDGLSGTCRLRITWEPKESQPVYGGAYEFDGIMDIEYKPGSSNPLVCRISSSDDSLWGTGHFTADGFVWDEGKMKPGFKNNPDETISLSKEFKRV